VTGNDPISDLLSGKQEFAEADKLFSCPIQSLVIDDSLDGGECDLVGGIGLGQSLSIVSDPNTYDALGARVAKALPHAQVTILDAATADDDAVERLMAKTRHVGSLIAIGSGTINDIVKFASHQRRTGYAVFATAPSMNGYVTATASISRKGEKLSLPATPPLGAFFDLSILAAAPIRLIRAGVGDSLCRSTAEIDWYLSHRLLDTPFLKTPFTIQAADEAALLARIDALQHRNIDAIRALTRLLVLGGLGMLITGNSQPGSQSEHLISHYIDMFSSPHPGSLHGEQVGLATWTMSTLQHQLFLAEHAPYLSETAIDPTALAQRFGFLSKACEEALRAKMPVGLDLSSFNRHLEKEWPVLRAAFKDRALSLHQLGAAFDSLDIAKNPEDLGLPRAFYQEAILHSRALRDRFTALDLAAMAGTLSSFVDDHQPATMSVIG